MIMKHVLFLFFYLHITLNENIPAICINYVPETWNALLIFVMDISFLDLHQSAPRLATPIPSVIESSGREDRKPF